MMCPLLLTARRPLDLCHHSAILLARTPRCEMSPCASGVYEIGACDTMARDMYVVLPSCKAHGCRLQCAGEGRVETWAVTMYLT